MRFTNFGSVVKTYKKNFQLRKKTFAAEKKAIQENKKKDREDRIEAVKAVQPLIKIKGNTSKKSNFLGGIKKFLGLMLAGFILQNLKSIIPVLKEVFKKIEDIVKGTKEFVEGVIGGVQNFFEGLDGAKKRMEDLLSPILNADLSDFVPFQNELDKVLTGVLGIAAIITGLYQGGEGADGSGDGSTPIDETTKGGAQGVNIAAQRKAARLKALDEAKKLKAQRAAARAAAREAAEKAAAKQRSKQRLRSQISAERISKAAQRSSARNLARELVTTVGSTGTANPISPGAGIPSGAKITPDTVKLFKENLAKMGGSPINLGGLDDLPTLTKESAAKDVNFFKKAGIDPGKLFEEAQLDQFGEDLFRKPGSKPKNITSPQNLFRKPPISAAIKGKFDQIMKNARGFIKPQNLKLLRGFAKDLGIGIAIEFAAGWAIDRGLEAIGQDQKSILERNVLRFNQLDKEKQKSIIERKNKELEKELKYQKTFFAKVEKVIALGDMTLNERKIKALASFLTAVSVSGAGSVYDLVSAGPLPNYLGSDVDTTLPSISKIGMPSLPPTGTGSPALAAAQQYGAARPGGRRHAGVDFDPADDKNSKFYSRIGGEVIYAQDSKDPGYGNVVDIYNAKLGVTERIAEGNRIHVKVGDIVKRGTLVQSGSEKTGVFHYEIRKGKAGDSGAFEGTIDPLKFLEKLKSNGNQASFKTSTSSLISSTGLNQSTTYSIAGMSVRREVNNIFIPVPA